MLEQGRGRSVGNRLGFSIPELLAVLVITSILATLAVVASRLPRARADLARLTAETRNLQLAEETYRVDHGGPYNGPFTPEAVRAANFSYTAPPDVTITVESTDPAAWTATVTGAEMSTNTGVMRPTCRLSLSGADAVACVLSPAIHKGALPDKSGGMPGDMEHIRTGQ